MVLPAAAVGGSCSGGGDAVVIISISSLRNQDY